MTGAALNGAHDSALLELADRHYRERNWSAALVLYEGLHKRDPMLAREQGVPLALGHCLIELTDDADPAVLARDLVSSVPEPARFEKVGPLRVGVLELCRRGDFARARRLLHFLAAFDNFIAAVYLEGFIKGRSGRWAAHLDGAANEPGFLQTHRWADEEIAAIRDRFHALRVLLIVPWTTPYDFGDRYARTANAFGLTARTLDWQELAGSRAPSGVAARLEHEIQDFRPAVVVYNSLAELGERGKSIAEQVDGVLADARRQLGVRTVASFQDVWIMPVDRITHGLGSSFDLVHHTHPLLLGHPALDDPRIYCYFHPVVLPTPTGEAGTIPRACSVGSLNFATAARIVWWAEAGQSGLPLDFFETGFDGERRLPAERYANLMHDHQLTVTLTRRANGVHIVTARSFEVLTVGGVLVEEDSVDTRYFLKPGVHYVPFETWADLAELIPWLLDNPEYRRRLAREGQSWVARHFSGDWFWAGLLDRLYPGAWRAPHGARQTGSSLASQARG